MNRLAFASCNNQELTNKLWPVIESRSPAAFVWAGDAIYADEHVPIDWSTFPPSSRAEAATPERLQALYRLQKTDPGYVRLIESNVTITGCMDDHDYGINNGDSTYRYKYESGLAFVDFLGEQILSPMRLRAQRGHGVYGVKLFDFDRPVGSQLVPDFEACIDPDICTERPAFPMYSNKTVAIFVLDVRTHKTPWKQGAAAFRPDLEGDFLGERQWKWLEAASLRSSASVNIVVNGLQVHANRFPNPHIAESWDKFPRSRQRLYDLLLQPGFNAPVLVSGDVHMTQMMRKDCVSADLSGRSRSLMELTTSGMTHSWGSLASSNDRQASWKDRYTRFAASTLMNVMHSLCPWTELLKASPNEVLVEAGETKPGLQFSLQKNFGEVEFDWENRLVRLRALGDDGSVLLSSQLTLEQLSGTEVLKGGLLDELDFQHERDSLTNTLPQSQWVCINHRGIDTQLAHIIGHVSSLLVTLVVIACPIFLPLVCFLFLYRRRFSRLGGLHRSLSDYTKLSLSSH